MCTRKMSASILFLKTKNKENTKNKMDKEIIVCSQNTEMKINKELNINVNEP